MQSRHSIFLVICVTVLMLGFSAAGSAADTDGASTSFASVPNRCTINNCGFNSACFVLSYYDRSVDLQSLIDQLEVDERLSGAASFETLKRAFASYQLAAAGYKGQNPIDIFNSLEIQRIAIVQMTNKSGADHFSVFYRAKNGLVGFFDYPFAPVTFDAADPPPDTTARMLGNVLYVTDERNAKPASDVILSEPAHPSEGPADSTVPKNRDASVDLYQGALLSLDKKVECDTESIDNESLLVHVPMENVGDSPVSILKARGSCGCFQGMRPDSAVIKPHEKYDAVLRFMASKFDKSNGTVVAFETNDPKLKTCNVRIVPRRSLEQSSDILVPFFKADVGGGVINTLHEQAIVFSLLSLSEYAKHNSIKYIRYDKDLLDVSVTSSEHKIRGAASESLDITVHLAKSAIQGRFNLPIVVSTTNDAGKEHTFSISGYVY